MKLNTDVRRLVKGKKPVYPTKRSMNLYFKLDRTTAPATAALYILFVLAVLLALSKVLVYDTWDRVNQLEERALRLEEQTAAQLQQLSGYDQVLEDYTRAAPTQEEITQVDRMEILALIDSTIRPEAAISQLSITGDQVLLSFSGVTLARAAELVSQLEQSPLVRSTSVDTAVSTREDQGLAEVHVFFVLAQEEETDS